MKVNVLKGKVLQDYIYGKEVGSKLPTVREMARHYGVSTPTIGKALAEMAADGFVDRRHGCGIFVGDSKRRKGVYPEEGLRIGYIVANIELELGHRVMQGLERVVQRNNCVLEIANSAGRLDNERRQVSAMINRGVDGIVLNAMAGRGDDDFLCDEFRGFPIVVVDLYERRMRRPHVVFDNQLAGREMTRHVIAKGYRRIAFIKFDDQRSYPSVDERVAGYRQALQDAGIPAQPTYVTSCGGWDNGISEELLRPCLEKLLGMTPAPEAIIFPSDEYACEGKRYLHEWGLEIPKDIFIAGFDNLSANKREICWPTTNPDFVRLGELAAEMLIKCIETGETGDSEIIMPCPILIPESARNCEMRNSCLV